MKETYFEIKVGQYGLLDDGRHYTILSVPSIIMCSNGTLTRGRVQLSIEDELHEISIEEFIDHVASVRDLKVREVKSSEMNAGKYRDANCEQKGWISVDEAMPKDGENVLVWCVERALKHDVAYRSNNKWYHNFLSCEAKITHWMPLPEGLE